MPSTKKTRPRPSTSRVPPSPSDAERRRISDAIAERASRQERVVPMVTGPVKKSGR